MNLLELRKKFVSVTGRYDLIVDTDEWADNGANYYFNAGARYLNGLVDVPTNFAKTGIVVQRGCGSIVFDGCRVVQQIIVHTESPYSLTYDAQCEQNGISKPSRYKFASIQHYPKIELLDLSAYPIDKLDILVESNTVLRAIIFDCKADADYLITLNGLYHNTELTADTDTNFWTAEYPELLIAAACYTLEAEYRNTEGSKSWNETIANYLRSYDNDRVEQELAQAEEITA